MAVTCAALILFSPLWGTAACLSGLAVTLLSGWLPLGAVVIPALFVPPAFLCHGREAGLLALILALIMLSRHIRGLGRILRGGGGAEIPRPLSPLRGSRKILRILPFRRRFVV